MPHLLLRLWREQHPKGHEQTALNFRAQEPLAKPLRLFDQEEQEGSGQASDMSLRRSRASSAASERADGVGRSKPDKEHTDHDDRI